MELKHLDIVKWKFPMNKIEEMDLMVVEDVAGNMVEVRHVRDGDNVSRERSDTLMLIGRATPNDTNQELIKKYSKLLRKF